MNRRQRVCGFVSFSAQDLALIVFAPSLILLSSSSTDSASTAVQLLFSLSPVLSFSNSIVTQNALDANCPLIALQPAPPVHIRRTNRNARAPSLTHKTAWPVLGTFAPTLVGFHLVCVRSADHDSRSPSSRPSSFHRTAKSPSLVNRQFRRAQTCLSVTFTSVFRVTFSLSSTKLALSLVLCQNRLIQICKLNYN
jgi:hypothetical protein